MITDLLLKVGKEYFERGKIIAGAHKPQSWEENLEKGICKQSTVVPSIAKFKLIREPIKKLLSWRLGGGVPWLFIAPFTDVHVMEPKTRNLQV